LAGVLQAYAAAGLVRERAIRVRDHPSRWAVVVFPTAEFGCTPQALPEALGKPIL